MIARTVFGSRHLTIKWALIQDIFGRLCGRPWYYDHHRKSLGVACRPKRAELAVPLGQIWVS